MKPDDRTTAGAREMTLPTFLGIGAQKAGTSWLHERMRQHPEIYMPAIRKEVHFFDWFFDKGIAWYQDFFPADPAGKGYRQWGEITPRYLYEPRAPARIESVLGSDIKLIVVLRDPVERLFSQYRMAYSESGTSQGPQEYARRNRQAFERGLYSQQLERYFARFGRDRVLVLFYEELFSSGAGGVPQGLLAIGHFLNVSNEAWGVVDGSERVGSTRSAGRPRFVRLFRLAHRFRQWCMEKDQEWIVALARKLGISNRSFGGLNEPPPVPQASKRALWEHYRPDVARLEKLLGRSLDFWGPAHDES